MQLRIPDNVSFEAAATVAVGIATTGYGLYKVLSLPPPDTNSSGDGEPILIYGGSTATGTIAIQFARMQVLATSHQLHMWAFQTDRYHPGRERRL